MIVDSTNPRIMADNIRELARNGGGGSDLPDVTAADNGKILGVVEGSWNKMDAPSGVIDYSTTEQDTGMKWIDGKPIYQKTLEVPCTVNKGTVDLSELGIDKVFIVSGFYTNGSNFMSLNEWVSSTVFTYAHIAPVEGVLTLDCRNNVDATSTAYVTLRYTKATTTRTKKKTTTKGEN